MKSRRFADRRRALLRKNRGVQFACRQALVWVLVSSALVAPVILPDDALAQTGARAEAAKNLSAGDKAARARNWEGALTEYSAAYEADPSARALIGMGNAQYELKRLPEAFETFSEVLKTYGTKMPAKDRKSVEARLKNLADRTGYLSIRVNESGATVAIDGKVAGISPVPALIRVPIGPHKVQVTKEGFSVFDQQPNVLPNGKSVVEVVLAREAKTGHLVVREKTGQTLRILIDGVDVGATPLELDVAPGKHDISGRSPNSSAPPQSIEVARGASTPVELVASSSLARLEIHTSDNKGEILIDGKPGGEGSYVADLSPGEHVVEVTREGYIPFKKAFTLAEKQTVAETVTLKQRGLTIDTSAAGTERTLQGIYGGFGLAGVAEPSGTGNEITERCGELGAVSCSVPKPLGVGAFGYLGYSWNPIGIELMLGGLADYSGPTMTFDGVAGSEVNPLAARPARSEEFEIARAGGTGAIQARYSLHGGFLRLNLAAGVGLSYKVMALTRHAVATEPGKEGWENAFVPDTKSYLSPAITGEVSVHLRLSGSTALSLGGIVWAETAGSDLRVKGDPSAKIAGSSGYAPIATPDYRMASGHQVFIGPFIGMQFGP